MQQDTPSPKPKIAVRILCQQGTVRSPTAGVEVDTDDAHRNSNRWVVDVEHDTRHCEIYELELLDMAGKPARNAVLGLPRAIPRDAGATAAAVHFPDPDGVTVAIARGGHEGGVVHYRLVIDATIINTPPRKPSR